MHINACLFAGGAKVEGKEKSFDLTKYKINNILIKIENFDER
jgi:hypothetical protein